MTWDILKVTPPPPSQPSPYRGPYCQWEMHCTALGGEGGGQYQWPPSHKLPGPGLSAPLSFLCSDMSHLFLFLTIKYFSYFFASPGHLVTSFKNYTEHWNSMFFSQFDQCFFLFYPLFSHNSFKTKLVIKIKLANVFLEIHSIFLSLLGIKIKHFDILNLTLHICRNVLLGNQLDTSHSEYYKWKLSTVQEHRRSLETHPDLLPVGDRSDNPKTTLYSHFAKSKSIWRKTTVKPPKLLPWTKTAWHLSHMFFLAVWILNNWIILLWSNRNCS